MVCCFHLYITTSSWQADNAIAYHDLPMIDQYALFQLENFVKNSRECYENYQFFKIFQVKILLFLLVWFSYVSVWSIHFYAQLDDSIVSETLFLEMAPRIYTHVCSNFRDHPSLKIASWMRKDISQRFTETEIVPIHKSSIQLPVWLTVWYMNQIIWRKACKYMVDYVPFERKLRNKSTGFILRCQSEPLKNSFEKQR